jgi:hypothetical protein
MWMPSNNYFSRKEKSVFIHLIRLRGEFIHIVGYFGDNSVSLISYQNPLAISNFLFI